MQVELAEQVPARTSSRQQSGPTHSPVIGQVDGHWQRQGDVSESLTQASLQT